jgi:protein-tyrosine-phosphatase
VQDWFRIDSAGTSGYHQGDGPDPRTCAVAESRGIVLEHTARRMRAVDLEQFDYVLAMDCENLERIVPDPASQAVLPDHVFGPASELGWCYHYEKADLYRQTGDWQKIVDLGDQAFAGPEGPHQASEQLPFMLGYGHTGRWDRAGELAVETVRQDPATRRLACQVWDELADTTPDSPEKRVANERVLTTLDCQGH